MKYINYFKWLFVIFTLQATREAFCQLPNIGFDQFNTGPITLITDLGNKMTISALVSTGLDMTGGEHFASGHVPGWYASHGTPNIGAYRVGNGLPPVNNRAVLIANSYPWSEGIFTNYYFYEGRKYVVKLKLTNYVMYPNEAIDYIKVFIANGLTPAPYSEKTPSSYWQPPSIPDKQSIEIPILTNFNNRSGSSWENNFIEIELRFTPNKTYNQFWIYPEEYANPGSIVLYVDDITASGCINSEEYSTTAPIPNFTVATDYIKANSNATVLSNQYVTFQAANYIELLPNFHVESGAYFNAYVAPATNCHDYIALPRQSQRNSSEGFADLPQTTSKEFSFQNILVYPNPSTDHFIIEGPAGMSYTLYNYQSKEVRSGVLGSEKGNIKVNTAKLQKGLHFLHINYNGKTEKKQIVLE